MGVLKCTSQHPKCERARFYWTETITEPLLKIGDYEVRCDKSPSTTQSLLCNRSSSSYRLPLTHLFANKHSIVLSEIHWVEQQVSSSIREILQSTSQYHLSTERRIATMIRIRFSSLMTNSVSAHPFCVFGFLDKVKDLAMRCSYKYNSLHLPRNCLRRMSEWRKWIPPREPPPLI